MPNASSSASVPVRLIVAIVLAHVAFIGNRFTSTLHAVALGESPLAIGTLVGLFMLGPMLLCVQFGRWSDRIGYVLPCALGLCGCVLATVLPALWPTMPVLCLASVVMGTCYMLLYVAGLNAVGRLVAGDDMTRAFSIVGVALSLSALLGPLVSGFMIDLFGHVYAYGAMGVFAVAAGVQFAWAVRRYELAPVKGEGSPRGRVWDLLADRGLRMVFILCVLLSMGWDTFSFLAPLHGVAAGLSATGTGIVVGSFAAGSFAVRLAIPTMARRLGEWRIIVLALFVTGAGFFVFPLLRSFWPLAAVAFVLGMSLGCSQPVSMSLIHRSAPPGRAGEAGGLRAAVVSFSQTTLPMVFGALGTAVGLSAVFWCASLLLFAGGWRAHLGTAPQRG